MAPGLDDPDCGRVLDRLFRLSNTLHPALRVLFYPEQQGAGDSVSLVARTSERVSAMLDILERQAPGPWPWAEGSTVLDVYLCPMLRWLATYPNGRADWFDLPRWLRLLAVAQHMDARLETQEAAAAEGRSPQPFSAPIPLDPPEGTPT